MKKSSPSVGVATVSGLAAAVAQLAGALVLALEDRTPETIAALATAAATLVTVLGGRYAQAVKAAAPAAPVAPAAVWSSQPTTVTVGAQAAGSSTSARVRLRPDDEDNSPLELVDGDTREPVEQHDEEDF